MPKVSAVTRRLRLLLPLLAVVLIGAALPASSAPSYRPTGPWATWHVPVGGVMRDATLTRGEWVYTNTLWLALGANADGLEREDYFLAHQPDDPLRMSGDLRRALTYEFFGMGRSVTNGDHELPTDTKRWPDGTGEVAELRMKVDADELFIRVLWHSYPSPTSQLATLTLGSASAAGAGLASSADAVVTIAGRGGSSVAAGGRVVSAASRDADHATEVRVPLALLPRGRWALRGTYGLADPADPTRYWTAHPGPAASESPGSGGPTPYPSILGMLFAREETWQFDERRQAEMLRSGMAGDAFYVLDPHDLSRQRTYIPKPRTGDLSRIYSSRYRGPDGIQRAPGVVPAPDVPSYAPIGKDFNVTYTRTGRLQDYAMRVPAAYDGRRALPLIVYLHGFGGTPEEPFRLPLGLVDEAEKRGYLFASLQGRGDTFYRPGLGELDVTEALADIARHYRVDPDRVYLMGHSMGGYGTNNIATRHPDLFAAVAPAQGTDSTGLAGNLRYVPWLGITSDQDIDPRGDAANRMYGALSGSGYDATLVHYRTKTHEYSSIYDTLPRIFEHFARHRRVVDPATVTWVRPPAAEDRPELGQVPDGAYWIDGVDDGVVLATSRALRERPGGAANPVREDKEVDEGGPSGRTRALLRTTRPGFPGSFRPRNEMSITALGPSQLTVDLRRARLVAHRLSIEIESEKELQLTLRGAADGRYRVLFGRPHDPSWMTVRRGVGVLTAPGTVADKLYTITLQRVSR